MSSDKPAKRPRTVLACQNCRESKPPLQPFGRVASNRTAFRPYELTRDQGLRKLSCNGNRPCARCQQEGRDCVDADQSERTPLTRQRMTELEQRYE
jgi:hypothetical protein